MSTITSGTCTCEAHATQLERSKYTGLLLNIHGRERKLFRSQLESVKTVKMSKQLVKLSEESLMREPEEVFDLLEKIGEG